MLWIAAHQASALYNFLQSAQTFVHLVSDAIQPSHSLSPLSPSASIVPSISIFSNELALHIRWPKYWSFSFSISPSNEYSGLIFFMIDWFDLLAVPVTLKSLLQHHSSKASILRCSAFFIVQLSHPHKTTGKTIALTRQTFVDKMMSLLFPLTLINQTESFTISIIGVLITIAKALLSRPTCLECSLLFSSSSKSK